MTTQITCPTCAAVIDVSELMKEQLLLLLLYFINKVKLTRTLNTYEPYASGDTRKSDGDFLSGK